MPSPKPEVSAEEVYRAKTCSLPLGETGDYESWIELVGPNFNLQCYANVELDEIQKIADILNHRLNSKGIDNKHLVEIRDELWAIAKELHEKFGFANTQEIGHKLKRIAYVAFSSPPKQVELPKEKLKAAFEAGEKRERSKDIKNSAKEMLQIGHAPSFKEWLRDEIKKQIS